MKTNDEIAMNVLQVLLQRECVITGNNGYPAESEYKKLAQYSYELADAMMEEKYKRDTHLCYECKYDFATCKSEPTFGLDIGYDNVIKCNDYSKNDRHKVKSFFRILYFKIKNFTLRK